MDLVKVEAVKEWKDPKNLKEVRGFLGFANFYRRFIKDFARIARPLNDVAPATLHLCLATTPTNRWKSNSGGYRGRHRSRCGPAGTRVL